MLKVKNAAVGKVQIEMEGRSIVLDESTPEEVLMKVHNQYPGSFVEDVEPPKKNAPQLAGKEDKNEK